MIPHQVSGRAPCFILPKRFSRYWKMKSNVLREPKFLHSSTLMRMRTVGMSTDSRIQFKLCAVIAISSFCGRIEAVDKSLSILSFCTSRKPRTQTCHCSISVIQQHRSPMSAPQLQHQCLCWVSGLHLVPPGPHQHKQCNRIRAGTSCTVSSVIVMQPQPVSIRTVRLSDCLGTLADALRAEKDLEQT